MAERDNRLVERAKRRVGTTLNGKWSLERLIGVGGMAAVYVGVHRNNKRAAIKILHTELSLDADIQARFLREGYVANSVGHAGAVRVDDDDEADDGAAYLVMELLDGESIEHRWIRKNKRLPLKEVVWIADRLLDVLDAAHTRGIVHRDIKPENIFLTTELELKVLDFGIARLRDSDRTATSTQTGKSMGTPAYMAPEQARGRWNEVDHRTDLWAVGATMYALLTGAPVHQAETPNEALGKAMNETAPRIRTVVPEIPEAVAEVIDRALEFQKRRRFSSARDMLEALRSASTDIEVQSPQLTQPRGASTFHGVRLGSVQRSARWHRWFLVATLLGGGVLGAITIGSRRNPDTTGATVAPGAPPPPLPSSSTSVGPLVTPADDVVEVLAATSASSTPSATPGRTTVPTSQTGTRPPPTTPVTPESGASHTVESGSCRPPYYLDERGIKRFRRECL